MGLPSASWNLNRSYYSCWKRRNRITKREKMGQRRDERQSCLGGRTEASWKTRVTSWKRSQRSFQENTPARLLFAGPVPVILEESPAMGFKRELLKGDLGWAVQSVGKGTANPPCTRRESGPYSTRLQRATDTISPALVKLEKVPLSMFLLCPMPVFEKPQGERKLLTAFCQKSVVLSSGQRMVKGQHRNHQKCIRRFFFLSIRQSKNLV